MPRLLAIVAVVFPAMLPAAAAEPAPRPGEYVREHQTGTLTISADARKGLRFEIESIGGNCHLCSLSGTVAGDIGHTDDGAADSRCIVSLKTTPWGIAVQSRTPDECRAYCGARAGFDGVYTIPAQGCRDSERRQARERFLELYRSRDFAQAADHLGKAMARCRDFIGWIEMDSMRNDLALAQLHGGSAAQCRATLAATVAAKHAGEEKLKDALAPCDAESYLDVAKATWFNQGLCGKK